MLTVCANCEVAFLASHPGAGRPRKYCSPFCGKAKRKSYYVKKEQGHYVPGIRDNKDDLIAMYKAGSTLAQIGEKYGVSRERVRQIISQYGVIGDDGGRALKSRVKKAARLARIEAAYLRLRGMTRDEFRALNSPARWGGYKKTPVYAFINQKKNAHTRGIPFEFIFADWWAVWVESGKFEERGCSREAYVMSRFNDEGAYNKGNVYITTLRLNSVLGRSLAHDRARERTEAHRIVHAAGGRAVVAQAFGILPATISQYMNNGWFPRAWVDSGGIQKLADLTAGAYTAERIIDLAVKKNHEAASEFKRVA